MANWRDIRAKSKGVIHAQFAVPAVYLTHAAGTPLRVNVRVHTSFVRHENEFTFVSNPGVLDTTPRLVFDLGEIPTPKVLPDALVFIGSAEVYRTGPSRPPRANYSEVEVSDADAHTIQSFTAPFETNGYGPEWEGIFP